MKNIAYVSVFLIGIFLLTSQCSCHAGENSTIIYAVKGQIFIRNLDTKNNIPKTLTTFSRDVTSFALDKNYLYVTVNRTEQGKNDSSIWRVNATNLDQVRDNDWFQFDVLSTVSSDILSMVIANGTIYAGRSDGIVWRCSTNESYSCEDFTRFNYAITAIGYNFADDEIYVLERVSTGGKLLWRLRRCAPNSANYCDTRIFVFKRQITLHVVFDAIWIGAEIGQIRKCSLDSSSRHFHISGQECPEFHDFDQATSMNIGASDKYLYVHMNYGKYIWRCEPYKITKACTKAIKVYDAINMGPFIIVLKNCIIVPVEV